VGRGVWDEERKETFRTRLGRVKGVMGGRGAGNVGGNG